MRHLLIPVIFLSHQIHAQGFGGLFQSFLGSGLQGNNGGGGFLGNHGGAFGGLLQNFANTGNGAGPGSNLPFGEFFKMAPGLLGGAGGGGGATSPVAAALPLFQTFLKPPAPAPAPAPTPVLGPAPAPSSSIGGSIVPDSSDYNEPVPTFKEAAPKPAPAPPPVQVTAPPVKVIRPPVPQGSDYDDIDYSLTGANQG